MQDYWNFCHKQKNMQILQGLLKTVVLEFVTWTQLKQPNKLLLLIKVWGTKNQRLLNLTTGSQRKLTKLLTISEINVLQIFQKLWWTPCLVIWIKYGEPERRNRSREQRLTWLVKSHIWEEKLLSKSHMIKWCMSKMLSGSKLNWRMHNKPWEKMLQWLSKREMAQITDSI